MPPQIRAFFVDGPLAGEERTVDTTSDGGPEPRVTLPDLEAVYERASWGDESGPVRYRLAPPEEPVFEVIATRWEQGYVLEVVGIGATQTHETESPDVTPEAMVRDYLHVLLDRPADSFDVRVRYLD